MNIINFRTAITFKVMIRWFWYFQFRLEFRREAGNRQQWTGHPHARHRFAVLFVVWSELRPELTEWWHVNIWRLVFHSSTFAPLTLRRTEKVLPSVRWILLLWFVFCDGSLVFHSAIMPMLFSMAFIAVAIEIRYNVNAIRKCFDHNHNQW